MLTGIIVAALLYVGLFVALWTQTRFAAKPGRTSRATVKVTPWGRHIYLEAPTEAEAAEAFLRADFELSKRGR